jgi:hypothetical protein
MKGAHRSAKNFYFYLNCKILVIPYGIIADLYSDYYFFPYLAFTVQKLQAVGIGKWAVRRDGCRSQCAENSEKRLFLCVTVKYSISYL